MPVSAFSTVASQNGNRLPSGTAIEGMSPSQINDSIRALMQCVREWYNEGEWIEYGNGDGVVSYTRTGDNALSIPANVVTQFHINRRIKIIDGAGNTLYGRITASSYSSPSTTLNLEFDNGAILGSGNPVSVKLGIISNQNTSMPNAMPIASIVSYAGASAPQGFLICDGSLVSKTTYGDLFAVLGSTYGTATATQFYLPNLQSKFPIGKSGSYALGTTGGAFAQTPSGSVSQPTFSGSAFTPTGSVSLSGTVANHTLTEAQLPTVTGTTELLTRGGAGGNQYIQRNLTGAFSDSGNGSNYGVGWFGEGGSNSRKLTYSFGSGQAHNHSFSGSASFSGASTTPAGSITTPSFTGSSLNITNPYISLNYIIKF